MSRSGFDIDGDHDQWAQIRWAGQFASAARGKRGQAFWRDLLQALDEMPDKRLVAHDLVADGAYCTIGALGAKRGVELEKIDPYDYDTLAKTFNVAHQLVREVEWMNDEAVYRETPEQRWVRMRDYVAQQIKPTEST
jgi:hypothetical protein